MPHEASDDAPFCPNAEPAESPPAPKPHERRAFSATLAEPAAPTITPILAEFGPFFPRIVVKSARFTPEKAARNAPDSDARGHESTPSRQPDDRSSYGGHDAPRGATAAAPSDASNHASQPDERSSDGGHDGLRARRSAAPGDATIPSRQPDERSSYGGHDAPWGGRSGGPTDATNDVPEPTLPFRACTLVPAFDAEASLRDVVEELRRVIPEAASGRRLVVIDDGSRDGTGRLAHELGCTVIAHGENRGKGAALRSGLATARAMGFQVALSVDADGQHPATSAREVLYASRDPEALVLGVRDLVTAGAPKKNRMSNRISNFFISFFSGKVLADTQCGLRRYPVVSTLALAGRAPGYAYESELLLRAVHAGMPMVETTVPVIYPPEELRVTHFDSVRDPARIIVAVVSTLHDLRSRKTP